MKTNWISRLGFAIVVTLCCTMFASTVYGQVVINEIDYDQPSTDYFEFIELKNIGSSTVSLDTFYLELINGSNLTQYNLIDLPDSLLAPGEYFVICGNADSVTTCDFEVSPASNLIQNGAPDAMALFHVASDTATAPVSNSGTIAYVFGGVLSDPDIPVRRGETFVVNLSAAGHPLWIKTAPTTGTGDQYNDGVINNGIDNGVITFTVPFDAPDTLYYQCEFHADMGGMLLVSNTYSDAVSYEGSVAPPYVEGTGFSGFDDTGVDFAGISRYPDGSDTDDNDSDFSLRCITPGAANSVSSFGCPNPYESQVCLAPTDLSSQDVTSNSATTFWTAGSGAVSYILEYDTSGFTPGTGTVVATADTFVSLSSLNENTAYDFYVTQVCGTNPGDTTAASGPESFTTLCGTVVSFPWTETFEDTSSTRSCWSNVYEAGSSDWTYGAGSSGGLIASAYAGSLNARFVSQSGTNSPATKLVSPILDLSGLLNPQVEFYYGQEFWSPDQNTLHVYYRVSPSDPWVLLQDYTGDVSSWTMETLNLPNASSTYQLAFEGRNNFGRANVLDNVTLKEAPLCSAPTALSSQDVTSNSATTFWTGGSGAVSFIFEYDTSGFTPGTGIVVATADTFLNLSSLSENTAYDFYVTQVCGINPGDTTAASGPESFTTLCGAVVSFPWTETFEDTSSTRSCWSNVYEAGSSDWTYASGSSGGNITSAFAGSLNARFVSQSGTNSPATKLVSPIMDLSGLLNPQVEFYYGQEFWSPDQNTLHVYYRISPSDPWVLLQDYTGDVSSWTMETLSLPNASSTYQLAFEGRNNFGRANVLDNVTLKEGPTCSAPTALSSQDVTSNSATTFWTAGSGAVSYFFEYDTSGFTPGSGTVIATADTFVNLSSLSENTAYDFYVTQVCGINPGDTTAASGPESFTTLCNSIVSFPWTETFEDTSSTRLCWSNVYEAGSSNWTYASGAGGGSINSAFVGSLNARFVSQSGTNSPATKLVSPIMDLSGLLNPQVEFYYGQELWSPDQNTLHVYYRVSPSDPWVLLQDYTSNISSWTMETLNLPNASSTYQLAFEGRNNFGRANVLDNVTLKEAPLCSAPTALSSQDVTSNGATAFWTAGSGAVSYILEYDTAGFTPGNGTLVATADTFFSLSSLNSSTEYDFYVSQVCGINPGDTTAATGPESFLTLCSVFSAPFSENFDGASWTPGTGFNNTSDAIDPCWSRNPATSSDYFWGVRTGTTGSGSTGPNGDNTTGNDNYIFTEASNGSTGDAADLFTPQIDLSPLTTPQLVFAYFFYGSNIDSFDVSVNDGFGWVSIDTIVGAQQSSGSDPWLDRELDLSAFANSTIQVRFRGFKGGSFADYALDDVAIRETPSCIAPSNLTSQDITPREANVNWVTGGGAVSYIVEYDTAGFTLGTGNVLTTSDTFVDFTGLIPLTDYDVYVTQVCGINPGDTSFVSGPESFTTLVACDVPTALTSQDATQSGVTLLWTSASNSASYIVEYDTAGFTPGNGTVVTSLDTFLSLTGLNSGTAYEFYVVQVCGTLLGDTSSVVGPGSFSTLCAPIMAPFAENFDGVEWVSGTGFSNTSDAIDPCWSRNPATSSDYFWGVRTGTTGSSSTGPNSDNTTGTTNYVFTEASNGSTGDAADLFTPQIDLSPLTTPQLLFAYFFYGSSIDSFNVSVNDGFGWVSIDTIVGAQQSSGSDPWLNRELDLSAFAGNTIQVRFRGFKGGSFADYAIDDVVIRETPLCDAPTALASQDVTETSATAYWTGNSGAVSYIVEYDTAGFTLGSGNFVTTADTFVSLSGLNQITDYDFYVTQVCGVNPGDTSLVSGPSSFTTTFTNLPNPTPCNLGLAIPDNACGTDSLVVPILVSGVGTQLGTDVILSEVDLIIEHTWDSDLNIFLRSPSGIQIPLSLENGGLGDNYGDPSNCPGDATNFSMTAATSITAGSAPFIGSYIPEGNFATFNDGSNPNGVWEIIICDDANGDLGEFEFAELTLIVPPACPPVTALTASNITETSATLSWTSGTGNDTTYIVGYDLAGTPLNALGNVFTTSDTFLNITGLTGSTGYDFYVGGVCGETPGDTSVVGPVTFTTLLVNDECSGALNLCSGDTIFNQSTQAATLTIDVCTGTAEDDVWYKFVARSTSPQIIVDGEGDFDAVVEVFSGSCGALTQLSYCVDNTLDGGVETVNTTGLTIGDTYYVQVYDWYSNAALGTFDITINDVGFASVSPDLDTVCVGGTTTLTASGGVSYLWSTGETTTSITTPAVMALSDYYVTVTNADGCTDVDTATVDVYPAPAVSAGMNDTICLGDTSTLTASGLGTFSWSTGESTASINVAPSVDTEYVVTITGSAYGCTNTDTVLVVIDSLPAPVLPDTAFVCSGSIVTLDAGNAGSTYLWSTNEITQSIIVASANAGLYTVEVTNSQGCVINDTVFVALTASVPVILQDYTICEGDTQVLDAGNPGKDYLWSTGETSQTISVTMAGLYDVTVTDLLAGCSGVDTSIITVNPAPPADAGGDVTICEGSSTTLTATGGNAYAWSSGDNTASATVSPVTDTDYIVTVTENVNNCSATDTVTVFVNPAPPADAGMNDTICIGETSIFTATGGDSYLWSTGSNFDTTIVTPLSTTQYVVTVTENVNNCSATDTVLSVVNPLPLADAGANDTICLNESSTLVASGGVDYSWSSGDNTASTTVSPTVDTEYIVTVTDANGCVSSDSVDVVVNSLPTADAGVDVTICEGETTTLTASGGLSYSWSSGDNTMSSDVSPVLDSEFVVTVTDVNGCVDTDTVDVFVNPAPPADAGMNDTICVGESSTFTASGGDSYSWSSGDNTAGTTVSPLTTTEYVVTVTEAVNNCSATDTVLSVVNSLPLADAGMNDTICFGESSTLTATGGVDYSWTSGDLTASTTVTPLTTTEYVVTVTDSNGCVNTDSVDVIVNALPLANAGADQTICIGSTATLTATGGVDYVWSNGDLTASSSVSPLSDTEYSVVVTDVNACSSIDTVEVFVNPLPTVDAGVDTNVCDGSSITLNATGGLSYLWSNGDTSSASSVSPSVDTDYSVIVTDGNGCIDYDTVFVEVLELPIVRFVQVDSVYCIGEENVRLVASPPGGAFSGVGVSGNNLDLSATGAGDTAVVTFTYQALNGCVNSTSMGVYVDPCPGIDEIDFLNQVQLLPNPFTDRLVMTFNSDKESKVMLTMTDVSGKQVWVENKQILSGRNTFELNTGAQLAEGMYFITISNADKAMTYKVIKSK